jgi:hypothetical protein
MGVEMPVRILAIGLGVALIMAYDDPGERERCQQRFIHRCDERIAAGETLNRWDEFYYRKIKSGGYTPEAESLRYLLKINTPRKVKRVGPGCSSSYFAIKPWADLNRKSKVRRIRSSLPMPAKCPHCEMVKVELVSVSGLWLEDATDYVWHCRHHATIHNKQLPNVPVAQVLPVVDPYPDRSDWDPELLDSIRFNNTMPGTFIGHSILETKCLAGRFY